MRNERNIKVDAKAFSPGRMELFESVCVCTHIYIHVYIYTHMYVYIFMFVYLFLDMIMSTLM